MFGYLLTTTATTTAYIKRERLPVTGLGWAGLRVGGGGSGTGGRREVHTVGGKSIKSAATKERKC